MYNQSAHSWGKNYVWDKMLALINNRKFKNFNRFIQLGMLPLSALQSSESRDSIIPIEEHHRNHEQIGVYRL